MWTERQIVLGINKKKIIENLLKNHWVGKLNSSLLIKLSHGNWATLWVQVFTCKVIWKNLYKPSS